MNRISTKKLLLSKWTSLAVENREKHFIITEVEYDDANNVVKCMLEAVMSHREQEIDWKVLKNSDLWLPNWR